MFFDSHCHLDSAAFDVDREAVVARARAAGVTRLLVPGLAPDQWGRGAEVVRATAGAGLAVGVHPAFIHELGGEALSAALAYLPEAAREHGAVAIGECGLDRRIQRAGGPSLAAQSVALRSHVVVARELGLPLVLHVVRAHGKTLDLLRAFGPLPAGGVVHGFSGSAELVADYCALGFSVSFGGAVTHDRAKKARAALLVVPTDRLLLETDAPDQHLAGGGLRGEPSGVAAVAAVVADLRGQPLEDLAATTTANARRLLGS